MSNSKKTKRTAGQAAYSGKPSGNKLSLGVEWVIGKTAGNWEKGAWKVALRREFR
jgi:hypothetical protein